MKLSYYCWNLHFNCQAVVILNEVKAATLTREMSQHRAACGSSVFIDPCVCSFCEGWELPCKGNSAIPSPCQSFLSSRYLLADVSGEGSGWQISVLLPSLSQSERSEWIATYLACDTALQISGFVGNTVTETVFVGNKN